MTQLWFRSISGHQPEEVNEAHPLPIKEIDGARCLVGAEYSADFLWRLGVQKKLFLASDMVEGDLVTGQTSFAATTPTFLLRVPSGYTAVPLFVNLAQSGNVGGGAVDVLIAADFRVDRWASGGTSEKIASPRRVGVSHCQLLSGATASAASGIGAHRLWGATIGQDISPAEGAVQGPYWRPELPYFLEGPASLLVFTYAAATGPTWLWSIGWAELETGELI